jgi:hypothetical protein
MTAAVLKLWSEDAATGSAELSSSHSSYVYRIHLAQCDTRDVTATGVHG